MMMKARKAKTVMGKVGRGRIFFFIMAFFVIAVMQRNSSLAYDCMIRGMKLCTRSVIPTLFPFMALSEIIVRSGASEMLGRIIKRPARAILGFGEAAAGAMLLGLFCGFPVGTRAAVSLYRDGRMDTDELGRVIAVANVPSSAFVIGTVGESLFGSRTLGVALYIITLLSAVLAGVAVCRRKGQESGGDILVPFTEDREMLSPAILTSSIAASALGMLNVCAFVVFFSVLIGVVQSIMTTLGASAVAGALTFCFFELTSGASAASVLCPAELAVAVVAGAVGWSGMSVHFQIMSVCEGVSVSFKRYFISKLLQTVCCGLMARIYMATWGSGIEISQRSIYTFDCFEGKISPWGAGILCLFALGVLVAILRSTKKWTAKAYSNID